MTRIASLIAPLCAISVLVLWGCSGLRGDETVSEQQLACEALAQTPNLTITVARWVEATETTPPILLYERHHLSGHCLSYAASLA